LNVERNVMIHRDTEETLVKVTEKGSASGTGELEAEEIRDEGS
jgi:hypothetical protein